MPFIIGSGVSVTSIGIVVAYDTLYPPVDSFTWAAAG